MSDDVCPACLGAGGWHPDSTSYQDCDCGARHDARDCTVCRSNPPEIMGVSIITKEHGRLDMAAPNRHHDLIRALVQSGHSTPVIGEQGFYDSVGRFLLRKPAEAVARKAGQLTGKTIGPILTSEDLW